MCSETTMPPGDALGIDRALRILTLVEFVVRRQLATEETTLAGLFAGNATRKTARPTTERLLKAF